MTGRSRRSSDSTTWLHEFSVAGWLFAETAMVLLFVLLGSEVNPILKALRD